MNTAWIKQISPKHLKHLDEPIRTAYSEPVEMAVSGAFLAGVLMKIVLHIGLPKNGSTSIQVNFSRNHEKLKSLGILMPIVKKRFIHPFHLKALLYSPDPEKTAAKNPKVAKALEAIDAAAAENPDFLFLSSEDLAQGYPQLEILENNLKRWSADVKVVAYMRDPVSLYRSLVQHHVKSQYFIPSPREWDTSYLDVIRSWSAMFQDQFTAVQFERSSLFNGSIVDDMIYKCDPNIAKGGSFDSVVANQSEVSEVSAVMQQYMFEHQPNKKAYTPENKALRRRLVASTQTENIGTKCKLKDEVAETILALKRNELLELRDKHGLAFKAIAYETIDRADTHDTCLDYNQVTELCDVDDKVISRLTEIMRAQ